MLSFVFFYPGNCFEADALKARAELQDRARDQMIFEARGRQLQEAKQQIAYLKEEIAQNERLSQHKETLAKGRHNLIVFAEKNTLQC